MTIELFESEVKGLVNLQKKVDKLLRKEDPLENQIILVAFGLIHDAIVGVIRRDPSKEQKIISKMDAEFDIVLNSAVKESKHGNQQQSYVSKACEECGEGNLARVFKDTTTELSDEDVEYYVKHPELKDDFRIVCRHCLAEERRNLK